MRRHITVARLLSRAFAVLVVMIMLSGTAGIGAALLQQQSIRRLGEHISPLRLANARLWSVLSDARVSLRGYLLTGGGQFMAEHEAASRDYAIVVRRMRALATEGAERAAVEEQLRLAGRWWREADQERTVPLRGEEAARWAEADQGLSKPILEINSALDADLARQTRDLRRRSDLLGSAVLVGRAVLTVLGVLIAAVTAVRTTRRITRPLGRLVTVLDRLGGGDHTARAPADVDLMEIAAVSGAVNELADEADRVREREAESTRLTTEARALGIRIRQHLSIGAVLDEAVEGLGPMLGADHVVVRLAGDDDSYPGTGASWSRREPVSAGADPVAPATALRLTEPLAVLSPSWLVGEGTEQVRVWNDLAAAGPELPAEGRTALRAAGARAVLTVGFHGGAGPSGAVILIRCAAGSSWSPQEARTAESVTADLGRGLLHAALYEREQELVTRLRDLDNAKTDFMSTVSHELRTPLTSIAGYVEMLVDGDAGDLSESQRRMIEVIERNTTRLRDMIEDLLVLSQIEAGTLRVTRQEVEYGWLITTAVAAAAPAAATAGVTIDAEVGGALAGRAEPDQIERVLSNLLGNAVKFTPRGGKVRVCAERDGHDVVVRVSDTGMGIPEAEQPELFNRFFRASNAIRQAVPGTGLGLAIVRTIVVRHGGEISVESREGRGTTVTVRLPP